MLSIQQIVEQSVSRAKRWHNGNVDEWTPLEWAGAMCGEAGEAANAAKKLKRLVDAIPSINAENRHFTNVIEAKEAVAKEVADTILYAVLLAHVVGADLEKELILVFNRKSDEYGFPERLEREPTLDMP